MVTSIVVVALLSLALSAPDAFAQSRTPQAQVIPGHFIVELQPGASQSAVLQAHGLAALQRWRIINGFSARMSEVAANRLAADGRVKSVAPDVIVHAFPKPGGGGGGGKGKGKPGTSGGCLDTSGAQVGGQLAPTGVTRIGAEISTTAGANVAVAVIDTGVDDCHPDLKDNLRPGVNLLDTSAPPRDDNGHGTHVAGIIGARHNDFGVVGVAPGALLHPVKVLDASGAGSLSTIVTAIDWSAQNGIQVANLSLGAVDFWCAVLGLCGAGAECSAIANAVAAGMTIVVAAGNSTDEALFYTPANCRDSVTVTAFADSNGVAGGGGASMTINGQMEIDDSFAQSFSNFSDYAYDMDGDDIVTAVDHPIVDFTAPGVEILSTMPTYTVTLNTQYGLAQNYARLSGTSMAAPHVAGAAARYIAAHGGSAEQVRIGLLENGECPAGASLNGVLCTAHWLDDPDANGSEPLVHAGGL